jgi:hypothetical protein
VVALTYRVTVDVPARFRREARARERRRHCTGG